MAISACECEGSVVALVILKNIAKNHFRKAILINIVVCKIHFRFSVAHFKDRSKILREIRTGKYKS